MKYPIGAGIHKIFPVNVKVIVRMIIYLAWFFLSVVILYATLKSGREKQMAAVTFFLLALGIFVGLGDMLGGYDRYIYGELYDAMADNTKLGRSPWLTPSFAFYGSEFGYGTFCALLTYITGNRYIFIFIATMVIYVLLKMLLEKGCYFRDVQRDVL